MGVVIFGVVALAGGTALGAGQSAPQTPAAARADVVFRGVRLWHFRGSALDGVGSADEVRYDRSTASGVAEHAEATLPGNGAEAKPLQIEAGEAGGHLAAQTLDARSGVVLHRSDVTIRSASAHYDARAHHVSGREPAELFTAEFRVQGQGFELDTRTERIDVQGPVEAQGEGR